MGVCVWSVRVCVCVGCVCVRSVCGGVGCVKVTNHKKDFQQ